MGARALWLLVPALVVLALLLLTEVIRKRQEVGGFQLPWWTWFALLPLQFWVIFDSLQDGDEFYAAGTAVTVVIMCIRGAIEYRKAREASRT